MISLKPETAERVQALASLAVRDLEYSEAILALAVAITAVSDCFSLPGPSRSTRKQHIHDLLDEVFDLTTKSH